MSIFLILDGTALYFFERLMALCQNPVHWLLEHPRAVLVHLSFSPCTQMSEEAPARVITPLNSQMTLPS